MKIKLNELLTEAHGKMCKRAESPIFARRKDSGTQYVYHIENPNTKDATTSQTEVRNRFANAYDAVKQAKSNPAEWEQIVTAFKNQTKYKTLDGFAFAQKYKSASTKRN